MEEGQCCPRRPWTLPLWEVRGHLLFWDQVCGDGGCWGIYMCCQKLGRGGNLWHSTGRQWWVYYSLVFYLSVEFLSEITLSSNNHIYIYYCVLCYIHCFSTFSFIYFILEILCSVVFCLTVSFGFILYLELWLIISFLVLFWMKYLQGTIFSFIIVAFPKVHSFLHAILQI